MVNIYDARDSHDG
ncbi:hypothetical protein ECPA31_5711, partial [Escherichia coli PA31]